MPKALGALTLFLFCFVLAQASWVPANVPDPMKSPALCGRESVARSAVCDPDRLLSKESLDVIEGFINKGSPDGSRTHELALLVLKSGMAQSFLDLHDNDVDRSGEKFANTVHDAWGVGDRTTNNGILLFLSISDRLVYISTGAGVKEKLTPREIQAVISNMRSLLRSRSYEKAISSAVVEISMIMEGKQRPNAGRSQEGGWDPAVILFLLVVFGLLVYGWWFDARIQRMNRGRAALDNLMHDVHLAANEEAAPDHAQNSAEPPSREGRPRAVFASKTCPICLEEFEADKETSKRRPKALACGHCFCLECLSEFLKQREGRKCPICRAPVDGTPAPPAPPAPPPPPPRGGDNAPPPDAGAGGRSCLAAGETTTTSTTSAFSGVRTTWSRAPELHFRLHRMRALYPDVMNAETMGAVSAGIDSRSVLEVQRAVEARRVDVTRIITDAAQRSAAQRSGAGGSSRRSFGGGGSRGGGGGRW